MTSVGTTGTTTDGIMKIISFSAGILFSAGALIFTLYEAARNPTNPIYLSIAMTIVGVFLPSPLQLSSIMSPTTITLHQTV